MITIPCHQLLFIFIEIGLFGVWLLSASEERGKMAGIGCLIYILVAVALFLIYGGVYLIFGGVSLW